MAVSKHVLITGGAGYIGSHTCVELLSAGYEITVFDNFCNSNSHALDRVESLSGIAVHRIFGDVRDRAALVNALRRSQANAVIHFAGLKAVDESVSFPLKYYDNNVVGTLTLLQAMAECDVKMMVFSSSATVYGKPKVLPFREDHPLAPTSPYGRTKLMAETLLQDVFTSDPTWRIGILRYFNPVGAHASGLIGEDPQGTPNNLMPFISQVAVGRRGSLNIWGSDYQTRDGTGVRDYIHVVDLAIGHLRTLEYLEKEGDANGTGLCTAINLGAGVGYSVLEMVEAFKAASGRTVPYHFQPRRSGDIAEFYADPQKALETLGWSVTRGLQMMCEDTWRWQSNNPQGYPK